MQNARSALLITALLSAFLITRCGENMKSMEVTASAYNSLPYQTRPGSRGDIAAWGDTLRGDIRSIAVSRDLLDSGLTHNKRVWIEGLGGPYYVKDKMHYRWRKRIDIHLAKDVQAARNWGKKAVTIYYYP